VSRIEEVTRFLAAFAPLSLAESWDNVGLLVGDARTEVDSVMTCLTLTADVAAEAVGRGAGLIVSHHPILFRPVQRLTAETPEGRMLLDLIAARIAVYSPHTGYDSARAGINQQLAELLDLVDIKPLRSQAAEGQDEREPSTQLLGAGRHGQLPTPVTLTEFNRRVKQRLQIDYLQFVGDAEAVIKRVGIACGSAVEFMHDAMAENCEVLLTGEARFHDCLSAAGMGINLVLVGHYASERPGIEQLAVILANEFPDLIVWPSEAETDPLHRG